MTSLRPQLADPAAPTAKPAFWFWGTDQRTVRTDHWRLIVHTRRDEPAPALELFDYHIDLHESLNVADGNPAVVQELLALLEKVPTLLRRFPNSSRTVPIPGRQISPGIPGIAESSNRIS